MEPMSNVAAIKTFFEKDGGRKVDLREMKELSAQEREELGKLSLEALAKQ